MTRSIPEPDLRILALADAKILPDEVQNPFDHWRIRRARDAVASAVRKRLIDAPILQLYLERLEEADDESNIFEGIYALAEVAEVHRRQIGLHSKYLILIMSGNLNPWGLLGMTGDFEHLAPGVVEAARELWRLANAHQVNVPRLLEYVRSDETLIKLEAHYAGLKESGSSD